MIRSNLAVQSGREISQLKTKAIKLLDRAFEMELLGLHILGAKTPACK